jgi:hypothetical protein
MRACRRRRGRLLPPQSSTSRTAVSSMRGRACVAAGAQPALGAHAWPHTACGALHAAVPHRIISHYMQLSRIALYRIICSCPASHYIALHAAVPHRIISHYMQLSRIALYRITCSCPASPALQPRQPCATPAPAPAAGRAPGTARRPGCRAARPEGRQGWRPAGQRERPSASTRTCSGSSHVRPSQQRRAALFAWVACAAARP